ncbi:MAG TPA: hypothetical protein VH309_12555 [Elusimicrobiota bacterium]|jgi:hypothetical protein|nr:hypothetical protein [Elusimicrobiota bacterium]
MKSLLAAALAASLAGQARAQSTLAAAFEAARALRSAPAAAPNGIVSPPSRDVLRFPAPPETAAPDKDDDNDGFRRALLDPRRSDRWIVPTGSGGIMLVVEKGYLDDARLDQLCADLREAVVAIPRLTGRAPLIRGRFTVYVYDEGPMSEADVPGLRPGERGLMLRFVKENAEPLFHEMTHLLAGYSDSQSLGEGIAEWVQDQERPGRANAFIPANANPDALAKAALAKWPAAFGTTIGAPGYWFRGSNDDIRFDFYYCSWSFAAFLMRRPGGAKAFWSVADAGGKPEAYQAAYGRSYDSLYAAWVSAVSRSTP